MGATQQILLAIDKAAGGGGTTKTVLASDAFTSSSNPIGGNWVQGTSETATMQATGGSCVCNTLANDTAYYNNGAFTWTNDQFSRAKITTTGITGTDGYGVSLRESTIARTYYRLTIGNAGTPNVELSKFVAGVHTSIATYTATYSAGAVLELDAVGTTLTVIYNGVTLGSSTDAVIATGKPGLSYSSTATGGNIDDWEGGSIT